MHAFGVEHSVRKVKYLEQIQRREACEGGKNVLVAHLFDVEETALRSDVGLPEVFQSVDDRCTIVTSEAPLIARS